MVFVLRDKNGNVVEPMREGFSIEEPKTNASYESLPTTQVENKPSYENEQNRGETAGLGQGILAGIEEANTVNPFGGIFTPAAAFLLSTFYDRNTPYSEIVRRIENRQEARRNIGRATEGDAFGGFREATQKTGEALKPIEDIMMGQALLSDIAKTARGAQAIQALSKVPGAKAAGTVLSKTVGSRNPIVRASSLAGLTGTGTAAYDIAKGENAATTIADSLSNAASIGLPVLGAGYLPAGAFYPAMALAGAGKGYVTRRGQNKETNLSDILGDVAAATAYGKLLRGEIIPEDTAIEKGSKAAKAVDKYKAPNKGATDYIEDEITMQGYDKDTPFWKVPLKKTEDFFTHFRRLDPTKASSFAKNTIQPLRKETEAQLKGTLDKQFPRVKDTLELQEEYSIPFRKNASRYDIATRAKPDTRPIKSARVDKELPEGTTIRKKMDDLYRDVKGPRGAEGEYNRDYFQLAREEASKRSVTDPTYAKVEKRMRSVQAPQKSHRKAWNKADAESHAVMETESAIKQSGTPENAAYKAKNTVWQNTHSEGKPVNTATPENLKTTGLSENSPLSPEANRLVKQHDYLVDAEKILNAEVTDAKNLIAQAGAAVPGGRLAKYSVYTKLGERALQQLGRLGTREAAEMLSKMTIGDAEKLLRAKWGSSVPFVETISAVKNLPKRKEKRK